jgi:hypothetical protein
LLGALPVRDEVARTAAAGTSERRGNASRQLRDVDPVATVQWRVVDRLGADDLAYRRFLRLQERGTSRHRDRLACRAQL